MSTLELVTRWPVDSAAAGVLRRSDPDAAATLVDTVGDIERPFAWASISKLLVAMAVLVAVEEGTISLDEPAGPPGSTVRHLLGHASGLGPDSLVPVATPERMRIYSNVGYDVLAETLALHAHMAFSDYLAGGVLTPLGMSATELVPGSSPASGVRGSLHDLLLLAEELLVPSIVSPATLAMATSVAFPGLRGVLPGYGRFDPCDWGLGFEVKGNKSPHWTGTRTSPATFGHFGRAGGFLWVDPATGLACASLSNRDFGPWAVAEWSTLADAVVADWGSSAPGGSSDRPPHRDTEVTNPERHERETALADAQRREREVALAEAAETERREQEAARAEAARAEAERREQEAARAEAARAEAARAEAARAEAEAAEAERREQEAARAEAARAEAEAAEAERREQEAARAEAEGAETERREQEAALAAAERREREAARAAAERAAAERREQEAARAEREAALANATESQRREREAAKAAKNERRKKKAERVEAERGKKKAARVETRRRQREAAEAAEAMRRHWATIESAEVDRRQREAAARTLEAAEVDRRQREAAARTFEAAEVDRRQREAAARAFEAAEVDRRQREAADAEQQVTAVAERRAQEAAEALAAEVARLDREPSRLVPVMAQRDAAGPTRAGDEDPVEDDEHGPFGPGIRPVDFWGVCTP